MRVLNELKLFRTETRVKESYESSNRFLGLIAVLNKF